MRFNRSGIGGFYLCAALVCLVGAIGGCADGPRKRPYGYIRIGPLAELQAPETRRWDLRLIIRRDQLGYSAMSTESTSDLAPLSAVNKDGREVLVSKFDSSTFAMDGSVLTGPAEHPLPYYKLELAQGTYGGPYDSLYAKVGEEVAKEWRLAAQPISIPAAASSPAGTVSSPASTVSTPAN